MSYLNPFSVVKANEYSDEQILEYWVDFGDDENAIIASLNPQELMPKYVLGSKGCGKTHILRYYSYDGRLRLYKNDVASLLENDKYIGAYSRLDGLSSMRFKYQSEEEKSIWLAVYNYYFELHQSIIALQTYRDVVTRLGIADAIVESIIKVITGTVGIELDEYSIDTFLSFLNSKRIDIDRAIIDYAFEKKLNKNKTKPIFPFGSLMFVIPKAFSEKIEVLSKVNFIYILDEYEKLRCDWQKESLNTLVFEKKHNSTIWVGARKNGYTTRGTMTGEPIHEGHEFQPIDLDEILKSDDKRFKKFVIKLFKKRLEINKIPDVDPGLIFEKFSQDKLDENLCGKQATLKHWQTLSKRLSSEKISEEISHRIAQNLMEGADDSPLHQKFKIYLFYQEWAKLKRKAENKSLLESSLNVKNMFKMYLAGKEDSLKEKLSKFKFDLYAQLAEENGVKYYLYSGFDNLVDISDCNPRIFLTLMKIILDDSYFRGNNPFTSHTPISVKSQYFGINETARWFLDDIEVYGMDRENLDIAMNHLLNFLYVNRYSDKPSETSLCAFYYRTVEGQTNVNKVINLALNESFLMAIDNQRKDKALGTPERSYQINRLISTLYNLPIARRGIIVIPNDMLKSIFDYNCFGEYTKHLSAYKAELNAPFYRKESNSQPTLFEE